MGTARDRPTRAMSMKDVMVTTMVDVAKSISEQDTHGCFTSLNKDIPLCVQVKIQPRQYFGLHFITPMNIYAVKSTLLQKYTASLAFQSN